MKKACGISMRCFVDVQEVAVVQGLQAQVVELQVALGLQRRAQAGQVELQQLLVQQFGLDALLDELREVLGIALGHLRLRTTSSPRISRRMVCSSSRAVARV
jgi:hypothetical protein